MTTAECIAGAAARRQALLTMIEQIARCGERLPGNDDFARLLGVSRQIIELAMRRLAADRLIRIERRGRARRITLAAERIATNWSRPPKGGAPVQIVEPRPWSALGPSVPASSPPAPAQGPRPIPDWQPATCQWLHGDARARNFCGRPVKPGSSYCETHHARCRVPPPEMRPAPQAAA